MHPGPNSTLHPASCCTLTTVDVGRRLGTVEVALQAESPFEHTGSLNVLFTGEIDGLSR